MFWPDGAIFRYIFELLVGKEFQNIGWIPNNWEFMVHEILK
jgi:hypothetical protein